MGTVPSLSSWATVVPEQAPTGQRPEPAAWGTTRPCGTMPGWTPGFLGASSRSGVPTVQAQLKGDVSSFQIRTTEPWADGHPQCQRKCGRWGAPVTETWARKPIAGLSGHPALPFRLAVSLLPQDTGQHPASILGSFWKEAGQPHLACSLPSPVHGAPEGLE